MSRVLTGLWVAPLGSTNPPRISFRVCNPKCEGPQETQLSFASLGMPGITHSRCHSLPRDWHCHPRGHHSFCQDLLHHGAGVLEVPKATISCTALVCHSSHNPTHSAPLTFRSPLSCPCLQIGGQYCTSPVPKEFTISFNCSILIDIFMLICHSFFPPTCTVIAVWTSLQQGS